MSQPELAPCPFCGWANPVWFGERHAYDWIEYAAYCANCDARGAFASTKEKAATAWNRRTPDAPSVPADVREAIEYAGDLLAHEVREFRDATGKEPRLLAALNKWLSSLSGDES